MTKGILYYAAMFCNEVDWVESVCLAITLTIQNLKKTP
jgi:hypothetical protein